MKTVQRLRECLHCGRTSEWLEIYISMAYREGPMTYCSTGCAKRFLDWIEAGRQARKLDMYVAARARTAGIIDVWEAVE